MTYVDDGDPTARVAYAIPRRVGTAVERNRIRRRLRAVLADQPLAPGAHLVSADRPVLALTHAQLVAAGRGRPRRARYVVVRPSQR